MKARIIVSIEVDALDTRGRDPRLCIADVLTDAGAWFRATSGRALTPHLQPLRNVRPGVVPEAIGSIRIVEVAE